MNGASWVFAGPGSPTYALRQWTGTAALADVVRRDGTLVVGSAAACTIGTHAIPVRDVERCVAAMLDLVLELRARARAAKDFATSDLAREGLVGAGIEVRDTPDGVSWNLRAHPQ